MTDEQLRTLELAQESDKRRYWRALVRQGKHIPTGHLTFRTSEPDDLLKVYFAHIPGRPAQEIPFYDYFRQHINETAYTNGKLHLLTLAGYDEPQTHYTFDHTGTLTEQRLAALVNGLVFENGSVCFYRMNGNPPGYDTLISADGTVLKEIPERNLWAELNRALPLGTKWAFKEDNRVSYLTHTPTPTYIGQDDEQTPAIPFIDAPAPKNSRLTNGEHAVADEIQLGTIYHLGDRIIQEVPLSLLEALIEELT